jgi:uncharacterized integral membrane protein
VTTDIIKHTLRFIILLLLQVLIVQNIRLGTYVVLLPYVFFILTLPFETPRLLLLALSFFTGLIVDSFYDSQGMHTAACTLLGFSRYYILKLISPRDGYEQGLQATVEDMGVSWFVSYAATLIFIHHFYFFFLEVFRFGELFRTFFRIILSSIGTFAFVYLIQFLFYTKRRNR